MKKLLILSMLAIGGITIVMAQTPIIPPPAEGKVPPPPPAEGKVPPPPPAEGKVPPPPPAEGKV